MGWIKPLHDDYRTAASRAAYRRIYDMCGDPTIKALSIGGGPIRTHPNIINLNISAFDNVDVVGDAHQMPIASNSIDVVHCEAVFEHLSDPEIAAAEMFRVMKPGALAYICTPFMQGFHGYPSHFQNFTIYGHRRLFERADFDVIEAGPAVGPAWAVSDIMSVFFANYPPRILRRPMGVCWAAFARIFMRPLDRWLSEHGNAYVLASTTYALVVKPPRPGENRS